MLAVPLYTYLKFFHVLMAITWVGGAIALQIVATRVVREGDPPQLRTAVEQFEFVGTRVFTPASLVLLGLGIWMVIIGPWSFTQFWVIAALAMFGYSFASGAGYLGPQLGKLKTIWADEGTESPRGAALARRLFIVSRVELVLLVLIVFDMIVKPFN